VLAQLGDRLYQFWLRFRDCFTSRTHDPGQKAYDYLRAQLTMDTERNFANIDRSLNRADGQALQHFMSNSPWAGQAVFQQIQAEIKATPVLAAGSTLILDESADEKAGQHNAGAARQWNGRLGKVDMSRVDTCLSYYSADAGLQSDVRTSRCGRWWMANCSCRKSGLEKTLLTCVRNWASRKSATLKPRSNWA
jgi:SRSO17 transposase